MKRLLGLGVALGIGAVAQALLGWWALALVGFAFGFLAHSQSRPALPFGLGVVGLGAARLAWLYLTGAPVAELHRLLADITSLPILSLALVLPALAGLCGATLGAALGRRVLFG